MDALKPFYTGWASGHELASQDNQRYTALNSQALSNTGTMNREMLGHVNDINTMLVTKRDKHGNPLTAEQLRAAQEFVDANQMPYSQGVFSPAPWNPDKKYAMPDIPGTAPIAPRMPLEMPMATPMPADLESPFKPAVPSLIPPAAPVVNPGLSRQMMPPVTAPPMPAAGGANLSVPQAPAAPQKRVKKKVTVKSKPSNPILTGSALTPALR